MFSRVILTLHSLFNRRAGLGRMMPEQGGLQNRGTEGGWSYWEGQGKAVQAPRQQRGSHLENEVMIWSLKADLVPVLDQKQPPVVGRGFMRPWARYG